MNDNENHVHVDEMQTMLERGIFEANGYKFVVKPVYLGEEYDYLSDVPYALYPTKTEDGEITEKDESHYAMALFRPDESNPQKISLIQRIKIWIAKRFTHKYEYYADNPSVVGLVKWIERKVFYNGKPVKFYDLERKYGLSKSEIVKLFSFFHELSGF